MSELQFDTTVRCPACNHISSTCSSNYECEICGADIKEQVLSEIASTNIIKFGLVLAIPILIILLLMSI